MIRRPNYSHYRCATIFYYKDPLKVYKKEWIEKCVQSIEKQSYQNYDVFILNYGEDKRYLDEIIERELQFPKQVIQCLSKTNITNHVHAMNFLLDNCFKEHNYDIVMNINVDDFYNPTRFEVELEAVARGFELVSTEFEYIKDEGGSDNIIMPLKFGDRNIAEELKRGINILCHPSICYSRDFWIKYGPYEDAIPKEDLLLWQKAALGGCKIYIVPEILTHYRISENQISGMGRTWNI